MSKQQKPKQPQKPNKPVRVPLREQPKPKPSEKDWGGSPPIKR